MQHEFGTFITGQGFLPNYAGFVRRLVPFMVWLQTLNWWPTTNTRENGMPVRFGFEAEYLAYLA